MNLDELDWGNFYVNGEVCCVDDCPCASTYGDHEGNGLCDHHFFMLYDADPRNQEPNLET